MRYNWCALTYCILVQDQVLSITYIWNIEYHWLSLPMMRKAIHASTSGSGLHAYLHSLIGIFMLAGSIDLLILAHASISGPHLSAQPHILIEIFLVLLVSSGPNQTAHVYIGQAFTDAILAPKNHFSSLFVIWCAMWERFPFMSFETTECPYQPAHLCNLIRAFPCHW